MKHSIQNSNHSKGIRNIRIQIRTIQKGFEAFESKFEPFKKDSKHSNGNSKHSKRIRRIRIQIRITRKGFEALESKFEPFEKDLKHWNPNSNHSTPNSNPSNEI